MGLVSFLCLQPVVKNFYYIDPKLLDNLRGCSTLSAFVEIDHEIFPTVILSLPLIQEGQLLVSGEEMYTILVNCLED